MKNITDVNNFIQDLTNNVAKSTNKNMILERLKCDRMFINKTINTTEIQKRVNELDRKILLLESTEIDYFVCLEKDKDYYYKNCVLAVELLGDLTLKLDAGTKYDLKKDMLWTYVGILEKEDELINWHHRDNPKKKND